jgi:hypothetical protein
LVLKVGGGDFMKSLYLIPIVFLLGCSSIYIKDDKFELRRTSFGTDFKANGIIYTNATRGIIVLRPVSKQTELAVEITRAAIESLK